MNDAHANAMNHELNTAEDAPEWVARQVVHALRSGKAEVLLGWPERLFALINRMSPALVDKATAKELPIIRRHASAHQPAPAQSAVPASPSANTTIPAKPRLVTRTRNQWSSQ